MGSYKIQVKLSFYHLPIPVNYGVLKGALVQANVFTKLFILASVIEMGPDPFAEVAGTADIKTPTASFKDVYAGL